MIAPKPLQKSKSKKLPRGVRKLTIAAGFLCRDGLVLCADTEETRGDMKFQVPKLVVRPEGQESCNRKATFAGAGDSAFIDKLVDEMWSAGLFAPDGIERMIEAMEDACIRVHQRFWAIYPAEARPEAHLIFGIAEAGETRLYKASGCIINQVMEYELTGCGDSLARYIANRSTKNPSVKDAARLSVYMLAETKKFVSGCGGESHIVVMFKDGSHERIREDRIASTTLTISSLENQMWSLLGTVTDHDMEDDLFEANMRAAVEYLRGVRRADEGFMTTVKLIAGLATEVLWDRPEDERTAEIEKMVEVSSLNRRRKKNRPPNLH